MIGSCGNVTGFTIELLYSEKGWWWASRCRSYTLGCSNVCESGTTCCVLMELKCLIYLVRVLESRYNFKTAHRSDDVGEKVYLGLHTGEPFSSKTYTCRGPKSCESWERKLEGLFARQFDVNTFDEWAGFSPGKQC